ncbi:hypothetical protein JG687_00003704 [Phytophthora cactorum]|uniref:Tetratricopeptide repeat n=1 Tax=Phytophthora cactorum TaxID=29920 RepID=A0A329S655_9STRA|nr:hypothetical protein Pcac1_g13131 [Phytophthora cactorum]KAG2828148.1 hypothetical protein PC112_g8586 [Phytophthora cactorum]KAG2829722.1 hypothetical protein PC111_g7648 [Phytophthora cactorum]KAG2859237.1 hypothetical protein PC113_g9126 [Phytophthora cactorum]KAG2884031.1 hypothetical protein PC114_g20316 [Phytophthora cactorum]
MSSASYTAWAKFDVEKELERVDQVEQREVQHKQQRKQLQAKESVETSATQAAQQSADILSAQAAVAALKAKKRVRKSRKEDTNDDAETDRAEKLQTQAALFNQKHELLQQILENRRLGDRAEKKHAKPLFENALAAIKKLEALAPELLKAEQEQGKLLRKEPLETDQSEKSHECRHEDTEDHSCGSSCSHGEKKTTPVAPLPKANDLVAIITMFYKDVYTGIGTCDLEEGRLAASTEAFKEVLIRDDVHLTAWLKRGEAFERMNAPLLAMLHYNRITNLDSQYEKGKDSVERVRTQLLTQGDAANDSNTIQSAVSELTVGQTFKEVLEGIQRTFEVANVLAVENFFDYSTTKYQVVLGCVEVLRARPECSSANEDAVSPVLRDIEISCHLNIASGCLEMQRNCMNGLSHCEQALRYDNNQVMTHFRMGQLYHALHNYEKALACFEKAKALVPNATDSQANEQRKQMLTAISKETDKCEFDRNQYDMAYLRTFLTAK